mmetsp:Transcript_18826/g.64108  ORF Transcript_18826/g.64108 Transcript_18826/m.64108 type:complete len:342 (-) Transcript_18826:199-1224(-)
MSHMTSKRLSSAAGRLMFSEGDHLGLYLPPTGLAAASTEDLALSVVVMPALAMEIVCCSITSWMEVRSVSSILSNSSMQQMPMSAITSAPPSSTISPVSVSRVTAAVRPAPELPRPVVYTPRGDTFTMCFSSWLFATPGSPMRQRWISPRSFIPSASVRLEPPQSCSSIAFLMSSWPKISGAMDLASLPYASGSSAICSTRLCISGVSTYSLNFFLCCTTCCASRKVLWVGPARSARKPVSTFGRWIPVMSTRSPGLITRVSSPLTCTVIVLGTWPMGTSSASSWIFTSWNLTNREPRVCWCSCEAWAAPRVCAGEGHCCSGMYESPHTSWNTSNPQSSHV